MIISQTPLRISFAGGGTDFLQYCGTSFGNVISTTIDKYVYVIVKKRFDDTMCISYMKTELVTDINDIKHDLIRESLRYFNIQEGMEIKTMGDIPSEGSGLGSSSAILVGIIKALSEYKGISLNKQELAEIACHIECDVLKKPIGYQDQYAAAYGGFNYYRFGDDVSVTPLPLPEDNFLLFFTGITRSASDILTEQKDKIKDNRKYLDKLRDDAFLLKDNLEFLPYCIKEGWNNKIKLASGVTNPAINKMIDDAYSGGCAAAKIGGAGGGGFLLVCCEAGKQSAIKEKLSYLRELPFQFEKYGSRIIFNAER